MTMKAVSFDIGHTLVRYDNPLNWKSLYEPALKFVLEQCGFPPSEERIRQGALVLSKYNTRENPRDYEVSSETIFGEIFDQWREGRHMIKTAKAAFYGFFQAEAVCFDDAVETLRCLRGIGIKLGVLTDAAYGMDNEFSLRDIASIRDYFDLILTSVDVGFRKPHKAGFERLLQAFDAAPEEIIYLGDEEKDISGANSLGIISVLIDRGGACPDFGQKFTIRSLTELCSMIRLSN